MTALLFDFFGTLVEYQPDRARLGSPRSYELARSMGFEGDHDSFVDVWDTASKALEETALTSLREFSMTDAAHAFGDAAEMEFDRDAAETLGRVYVEEWARHVVPIDGAQDLIHDLAERYTIGVVSNTHDVRMVPRMLDETGIASKISAIVLSIEHGWLKPHPSIYDAALEQVRASPADTVFIGDSFEPDYAGPIAAGMTAFLIDPARRHEIDDRHRLDTVLDLPALLDQRHGR